MLVAAFAYLALGRYDDTEAESVKKIFWTNASRIPWLWSNCIKDYLSLRNSMVRDDLELCIQLRFYCFELRLDFSKLVCQDECNMPAKESR